MSNQRVVVVVIVSRVRASPPRCLCRALSNGSTPRAVIFENRPRNIYALWVCRRRVPFSACQVVWLGPFGGGKHTHTLTSSALLAPGHFQLTDAAAGEGCNKSSCSRLVLEGEREEKENKTINKSSGQAFLFVSSADWEYNSRFFRQDENDKSH